MKYFKFNLTIPKSREEDCKVVRDYAREELQIDMSLTDAYLLWASISDSLAANWLCVDIISAFGRDWMESHILRRGNITQE